MPRSSPRTLLLRARHRRPICRSRPWLPVSTDRSETQMEKLPPPVRETGPRPPAHFEQPDPDPEDRYRASGAAALIAAPLVRILLQVASIQWIPPGSAREETRAPLNQIETLRFATAKAGVSLSLTSRRTRSTQGLSMVSSIYWFGPGPDPQDPGCARCGFVSSRNLFPA